MPGIKGYNLRIIATVLTALLVVLVLFCCILYFNASNIIDEQAGVNAQNIAVTVASFLSDDADAYRGFLENMNDKNQYYKTMKKNFSDICVSDAVRFIYTERRISDESIEYVLDSEPENSMYASPPGTLDEMNPMRVKAYSSMLPCHSELVNTDFWGYYITAYAPIFDSRNGEFLGLVGVDVSAHFHDHLYNYYLWTMVIAVLVTIVIAGAVLIIFSGSISGALIFDNLTGAYNRKYFNKALKRMCSRKYFLKTVFCLLLLDLDHFKLVNDEYGHQFGDTVLMSTVTAIGSVLRSDDLLARFGGEEFVILLPNTNLGSARSISQRILETVSNNIVYNEQLRIHKTITISIGIVQFKEKFTPEKMIHLADMAMYEAKKTRNTVAYYDHEKHESIVDSE